MIKKNLARILYNSPTLTKFLVKLSLKIHNAAYRWAGTLSIIIEPDNLHPKHRLLKYHDWFKNQITPGSDILDVGCGNGALAFDLKNIAKSITAIDINSANIKHASVLRRSNVINYVVGDATTMDFSNNYHFIILSNVLEHIDNRVDFLKKLYANQNPKKPPTLLLRLPMVDRDWITLYKKEIGIEWRLDPTHYVEYTLNLIKEELEYAGLYIVNYDVQYGEFYGVIKRKPNE